MLNKRLITQLSGKMAPALRIAPAILPNWAPLCVTRCSFGHYIFEVAKSRASSLDWRPSPQFGRGNSKDSNSVNRP